MILDGKKVKKLFKGFEHFDSGEVSEAAVEKNKLSEENELDKYFDDKWSDKETKEVYTEKITCKNEDLEGKEHPETGVPFERKTVHIYGKNIEGVFPQFESKCDVKMPEELYKENDQKQFEYCSKQLKETVQKDPKMAEQFSERQYEQIVDGAPRVSGYTWHHTENPGEMQLVNADIHAKTGHTGGRYVWGGGTENR